MAQISSYFTFFYCVAAGMSTDIIELLHYKNTVSIKIDKVTPSFHQNIVQY